MLDISYNFCKRVKDPKLEEHVQIKSFLTNQYMILKSKGIVIKPDYRVQHTFDVDSLNIRELDKDKQIPVLARENEGLNMCHVFALSVIDSLSDTCNLNKVDVDAEHKAKSEVIDEIMWWHYDADFCKLLTGYPPYG